MAEAAASQAQGGDSRREGYAKFKGLHSCRVVVSTMGSDEERDAAAVATKGVDTKAPALKDVAEYIKRELDQLYPGSGKGIEGVYHVVVGRQFASMVSHETRHYCHLVVDALQVVIWKSKDSPFTSGDM